MTTDERAVTITSETPTCDCHGEPKRWHKRLYLPDGGHWECRVKHREEQKAYNAARPGEAARKQVAYSKTDAGKAAARRKHDRKREMVAAEIDKRGGACEECGYADDLVWHHRDPSLKKFKISEAILMSYEAVEAEFAKCDLLCPNCHARRHRLASEVK